MKRRRIKFWFFLITCVLLIGLIIAAPSFHTSQTNSTLIEDQTSVFTYNFTSNVTNTGGETLIFEIVNLTSSYLGSHLPSYFTWISLDSSTGVMTINSSQDNETGKFNITVWVHNPGGQGQSDIFYFISNATNDYPNFTKINLEYNLTQNVLFSEYINATDEEKHYPLFFNITFNSSCSHANWSIRSNCTLFSFINFSNTSALMNFIPLSNDVGIYYANISVRDFGENYTCSSNYCLSNYSQNRTIFYSKIITFNIFSSLTVNVSECENKVFQENATDGCYINITTFGQGDTLNISSNASLRNYQGSVSNKSWFYATNQIISQDYFKRIYVNVTPGKTEVGNWTINFSVRDFNFSQTVIQLIHIYVNRTNNDAPRIARIANKETSINLLTRINISIHDDDLLIPDKNESSGGYNETITFNTTIFNQSDLSQELSLSNFSVQILNMPVSGTNRTEAKIEFTPNLSEAGNYTINLSVSDKENSSVSLTFNLSILSNSYPVWNESIHTVFVIYENNYTALNLSQNVSDIDGNALSFSFLSDTIFPNFNISSNGIINFTPGDEDVGQHIVGITVSDGYLTNTSSFNFSVYNVNDNPYLETPLTVINASADASLNINCSEDDLTTITLWIQDGDFRVHEEQKSFYNESLNVSVSIEGPNSTLFKFVKNQAFPTPDSNKSKYDAVFISKKADVGSYNITLNISDLSNSKISLVFNLTILQINHNPVLMNLNNQSSAINRSWYYKINATDVEDGNTLLLNLNFTFRYVNLSGVDIFNTSTFNSTTGEINITFNDTNKGSYYFNITVNDSDGKENSKYFWIYVYDAPVVNFPNSSYNFNLVENFSSNLTLTLNHTVLNNLSYLVYIERGGIISNLLYNSSYYGNETNLTFSFIPNFTDETYSLKNLTVIAYPSDTSLVNRSSINISSSWNIIINHTNYPLTFLSNIGGSAQEISGGSPQQVTLTSYFFDYDASDSHRNQSIKFIVNKIASGSGSISISVVNWTNGTTPTLSFSASDSSNANYSVTAYEYNESNSSQILQNVTSNNFFVNLTSTTTTVTTPTSGGGGGSVTPIAFKIITPGKISSYAYETIKVPLSLVNKGTKSFEDINITAEAFKDGVLFNKIETSFDKSYFKSLDPGKTQNLTLTMFFNTNKTGDYEILVSATSKSPIYNDWAKIYINLQKVNESAIEEYILFTEEFIVENPECIELTEIVGEAKKYFEEGDYSNARLKAEQAINACKEYISQVSLPTIKPFGSYGLNEYLVFATLGAFLIGIIYYLIKRRGFKKSVKISDFSV